MAQRDHRYNASEKGKKRKRKYRKNHREAVLAYGRMYYRGKRLRELRVELTRATTDERRAAIKAHISRLLSLIRKEEAS